MKFLFDFFPLILFFISYKIWGIYVATGAIIVASGLQIAYFWARHRRFETMHVVTFLLLLVFGGATIILHDASFLKWKVSIANWLFGAAFLISPLVMKKNIIQHLMDKSITLEQKVWTRLNASWGIFFLIAGTLNIIVAYSFSTDIWVDFKVFGLLGLTILFIVLQTFYLVRHIDPNNQPPKTNGES